MVGGLVCATWVAPTVRSCRPHQKRSAREQPSLCRELANTIFNAMTRTSLYTVACTFGLLLLVSTGCTTTNTAGSSSSSDPTVISQKQIQEVGDISNAYNLVQRLHPQWLRKRGRNSISDPGQILVYVEDSRQGGTQALRRIQVIDVQSIEFLRANEATMRYGSGHDNGAILVHMKGS